MANIQKGPAGAENMNGASEMDAIFLRQITPGIIAAMDVEWLKGERAVTLAPPPEYEGDPDRDRRLILDSLISDRRAVIRRAGERATRFVTDLVAGEIDHGKLFTIGGNLYSTTESRYANFPPVLVRAVSNGQEKPVYFGAEGPPNDEMNAPRNEDIQQISQDIVRELAPNYFEANFSTEITD